MTLKELAQELKIIKENHLTHIESDMKNMRQTMEKMDSRLWWIFTTVVGSVIVAMLSKALGYI